MALALVIVGERGSAAQDSPLAAVTRLPLTLYAGPGLTYAPLAELDAEAPVTIVERNAIGTWVRVRAAGAESDGWVVSGRLALSPDLHFADVPVNALPDADMDSIPDPAYEPLYSVPVIPVISDAMREVYARGQTLGNDPQVITKVGDSLSEDSLYLKPFSLPERVLGAYDYLDPIYQYFGASTAVNSLAAVGGMTSYSVFDPLWARDSDCEANETPLVCEYRLKKPSVAFIMFGPNDLLHMDADEYDLQMRQIVAVTLKRGIIPVLSLFSFDPESEQAADAVEYNRRLVQIAADTEVPLINLWLAAQPLPDYGLEGDLVHMKHWGYRYLRLDNGIDVRFGAALRNLLALRTLDEIYSTIILPAQTPIALTNTPQPELTVEAADAS
jgi:hypothetical protein